MRQSVRRLSKLVRQLVGLVHAGQIAEAAVGANVVDIMLAVGAFRRAALRAAIAIAGAGLVSLLGPVRAIVIGIALPQTLSAQPVHQRFRKAQPVAAGLQHAFRQVDFAVAQRLVRPALDPAIAHGLAPHFQVAVALDQLALLLLLMRGQDFDVGGAAGLGVIIDLDRLHVGVPLLPVQRFDQIGLALVQVDGAGVQEDGRCVPLQFADGLGLAHFRR